MDLASVFNQDPNRFATAAVNDMQGVQKSALANQFQSLQNDRYGQVTPYEVMQQRLAGLRADAMSDQGALDTYKEGTLGQFGIQARANRRGQEIEDMGINPELDKALKEHWETAGAPYLKAGEQAMAMYANGANPDQVEAAFRNIYGDALPQNMLSVLRNPQAVENGVRKLARLNERYIQAVDVAEIQAETYRQNAAVRANGSVAGADVKKSEHLRKVLETKHKVAKTVLENLQAQRVPKDPEDRKQHLLSIGKAQGDLQQIQYDLDKLGQTEQAPQPQPQGGGLEAAIAAELQRRQGNK